MFVILNPLAEGITPQFPLPPHLSTKPLPDTISIKKERKKTITNTSEKQSRGIFKETQTRCKTKDMNEYVFSRHPHIFGGVRKTDKVSFARNLLFFRERGGNKKRQAKGQQHSFQETPNEYPYITRNTKIDRRRRHKKLSGLLARPSLTNITAVNKHMKYREISWFLCAKTIFSQHFFNPFPLGLGGKNASTVRLLSLCIYVSSRKYARFALPSPPERKADRVSNRYPTISVTK